MELSASVPRSSSLWRKAKAIPLRPFFDRKFTLVLAAAIAAAGLFFFFGDQATITAARTLPAWVVAFFRPITRLGYGGYLLWPTGILVLLLLLIERMRLAHVARATLAVLVVRLSLLFAAVAAPGLVTDIIKAFVGRSRPKLLHSAGELGFDPLTLKAAAQSFPSGHTTVAFATAVVLGAFMPRLRIPLLGLAVLVGISRIVLGAHYPSDAIGGAIVGTVFAMLVIRAFAARRLSLAVTLDGRIKPKPMPRLRRLAGLAASILATLRGRDPARPLARRGEIFERN
jgi:membrane-associated phospholipid phosphatase